MTGLAEACAEEQPSSLADLEAKEGVEAMEISEEKDFPAKILEISEEKDSVSNSLKEVVNTDAKTDNGVESTNIVNGGNGDHKLTNGHSEVKETESDGNTETSEDNLSQDIFNNDEKVSQVNGGEKAENNTIKDKQEKSEDSVPILPKEDASFKPNENETQRL